MDSFTARIATDLEHARVRAERLRDAAPALARKLVERGATRVVLIGSLARGDRAHAETDIDFVVWGLTMSDAYELGGELGAAVQAMVDIIPAELMGPRLERAVQREGIDLTSRHERD